MAYLLDANVFIAAKNLYYGFDFCPAFWDWLIAKQEMGDVFSVGRVGDEVGGADDQLSQWVRERGAAFFRATAEEDLPSLEAIRAWASEQRYEPAAINIFLQSADYYLVAQAHAGGHTVVTQEVPANSLRKVKIPNVCLGMRVSCLNTFQMLRRERARFMLAGPS